MKIAAVVILYHPTLQTLDNIESYYDYVDRIYVFDNTEEQSPLKEKFDNVFKINLYQNFSNEGLGTRLNEGCKLAIKEGFEWILTMDQDSSFTPDTIKTYINCFKNYTYTNKVAMFGIDAKRRKVPVKVDCVVTEVADLITSGSLVNLTLFAEIGGFDESLFIDLIDNEYCAKARIKGYKIMLFPHIHLTHQLGKLVNHASIKTLFLIKKSKEVHSPLRCYYMYRNMLYLEKKYAYLDKRFTQILRRDVIARIKVCLLYGRDAINIFKYLYFARQDFLKGRMGRRI